MARVKRPQPAGTWMAGYGSQPSLEAHCKALEARLNEGRPARWIDAIACEPLDRDWWPL